MTPENSNLILATPLLVAKIAQALVDDESAVRIEVESSENGTMLRVHVAASDIGKMVGKEGRTARSLRVILGAAGVTQGVHYSLDIVESSRLRETQATVPTSAISS
jgi:predicted RNA-binding protein YlqC (UPF0109 family)